MNPIIWLVVFGAASMIVFLPRIILWKIWRKQAQKQPECEPFMVSEYYARMEKYTFDILEAQEPVDQTITLWWGLDGLRLNEDGSLEWVSRKKNHSQAMV